MTILIIVHIIPGIIKSFFSKDYLPLALRMRKLWAQRCLRLLGVQIHKKGNAPENGPFIFIGNHRSYLDPIVALRDIEALPVAKAEVSSWPIIGYGAKVTGIMWVKRESKRSRANTLKAMEEAIQKGFSVLIYPEGTTHVEPQTRQFSKGAFRLAASMDIGIIPIAIEYFDLRDAWVSDDTFIPHFLRCFGKKKTQIKLAYGAPIFGENGSELLQECQKWIDSEILEMRKEIGLELNKEPVAQ